MEKILLNFNQAKMIKNFHNFKKMGRKSQSQLAKLYSEKEQKFLKNRRRKLHNDTSGNFTERTSVLIENLGKTLTENGSDESSWAT